MTLKEQIAELEKQLTLISTERDDARSAESTLSANLAALQTDKEQLGLALDNEKANHVKTIESLQAAALEIEDLKAKLAESETSAGKKAQEQLAAIGVAPVAEETPAKPESKTLADHISELQKISDERARAEYFSANIAPKLKH